MASKFRKVSALKTAFTYIKKAAKQVEYITNCVSTGSASVLYADPDISNDFYDEGTAAAEEIKAAMEIHRLAPTDANLKTIADKRKIGNLWTYSYVEKVEIIANDDANRDSREEAATNISHSFLTPQEIRKGKKGKPKEPILTAEFINSRDVFVELQNGKTFKPYNTIYVIVSLPASDSEIKRPEVSIVEGQLKIKSYGPSEIFSQTADGKGAFTTFKNLISGVDYMVFAYAQNGKKQCSGLSNLVYLLS